MSLISWRLLYRMYRITSGSAHWFRRRFTAAGFAVLGGAFATGLLGADTENTVAYQVFALLGCLLLTAFVWSWWFRLRFTVDRLLPRYGTVGEPLRYHARLRHTSPRTQAGLTWFEDLADPRPTLAEWRAEQLAEQAGLQSFRVGRSPAQRPPRFVAVTERPVPPAPPGRDTDLATEVVPVRRGRLEFAGATLARTDPLGLFRAWARTRSPQSVLVLPRRYALPPLNLPGSLKYQEGGVNFTSNVGQSDEFVSLRDYRRGDPVRHIHWRSWARTGKPIVKEFQDEFFVRHALVLDTFAGAARSEEFEEAVSVAASFACSVRTQESLLDLLFVGTQAFCFTAGRGLAHADQMLEVLASVAPGTAQPFGDLERLVLGHANRVSGCVFVLLAWDEPRRELLRKLVAGGTPMLVLVVVGATAPTDLPPGPLAGTPGGFHVLQAGRIPEGLARL